MKVTRFLVRARTEPDWTEMGKAMMAKRIHFLLKSSWSAGQLVVHAPEPVALTEIKVFEADVTAPFDPVQAAIEGFLARENPYPRGSWLRKKWATEFREAAEWVFDHDDPYFQT